MVLAILLVETPSGYCLLCYNSCSVFVVLPYSLSSRWNLPYSANLSRLRHPIFDFVLFCFCFESPFVSCVVLGSPAGHRTSCVFATSSLSLPSSCAVFRLGFLRHPSVVPSAGHVVGLIVPANSNVVSSDSPCALSSRYVCFISSFFSCLCFFFFSCSYFCVFSFCLFCSFFGCI